MSASAFLSLRVLRCSRTTPLRRSKGKIGEAPSFDQSQPSQFADQKRKSLLDIDLMLVI
jgi:hypothetical protein